MSKDQRQTKKNVTFQCHMKTSNSRKKEIEIDIDKI